MKSCRYHTINLTQRRVYATENKSISSEDEPKLTTNLALSVFQVTKYLFM